MTRNKLLKIFRCFTCLKDGEILMITHKNKTLFSQTYYSLLFEKKVKNVNYFKYSLI